jgi:primosomal protein N'
LDREFVRTGVKDEDSGSESDGEDNVHDIQAAHSERVANNHYGRKGLRINTTTVNLFRGVSDKWQGWLAMKSRPSRSWFGRGGDEQVREPEESKEKRIEMALERVHGAGSVWRSEEQKRFVSAIVEGVSPVVCILPTGGGKTTVILVPALVNEGKTTLVMTPYIALADDLVERCKTSGISCMRWTNRLWNERLWWWWCRTQRHPKSLHPMYEISFCENVLGLCTLMRHIL